MRDMITLGNNVKVHKLSVSSIETPIESIGEHSVIWRWTQISRGATIGHDCMLANCIFIGEDVVIGDNCRLQQGCFIPKGVTFGHNIFCGPSTIFTNDKRAPSGHIDETIVEDWVTIGANCTILPGITLGKGCRIGAGSVVTHSVPPLEIWVGNPARLLKNDLERSIEKFL